MDAIMSDVMFEIKVVVLMKYSELLISIAKLTEYQKSKIEMFMLDTFVLNKEDKANRPKCCPYCKEESRMIEKGFNQDKQRYQCKECEYGVTYNSYTITMYSKIERSMFQKIVFDTLSCIPLKKTAADLNISIPCIFENRHKSLCVLEEILLKEHQKLSGTIEFDETYELES